MEKTNVELKRDLWKKIKIDFLKDVPKQYKIEVEGIEEDDKYFHPVINLDENTRIKGQCDTGNSHVYGLRIELKNTLTLSPCIYSIHIDFNDNNEFKYIVSNFEQVKAKLNESFEFLKNIYVMKDELNKVQNNVIYNSISKLVNQDKIKQSLKSLYKVTEFIENQKLTD